MFNKSADISSGLMKGAICIGFITLLSACSSDGGERPEYMKAQSVKSLEVPPKLTSPDTRTALRFPQPSASAKEKAALSSADIEAAIAPSFDGVRLKQQAGLYFIEMDSPVSDVWAMLPDFLRNEGIETERVEKLMGFVDTRWMDEYKATYGGGESSSWFKRLSPDYKDKFRIRVEPSEKSGVTRLYVAHRGMQVVVSDDGSHWQQRASEAFLEREILYRFVLFAGAGKSAATTLLADYRPYQSRAQKVKSTTGDFEVAGEPAEVWQRIKLAVDRLGVDVTNENSSRSTLNVSVGDVRQIEKLREEEKSWFGRLFNSDDVVVDEDEDYEVSEYKPEKLAKKEKIKLKITLIPSADSSKVLVQHENGKAVTSGTAIDFKHALFNALK